MNRFISISISIIVILYELKYNLILLLSTIYLLEQGYIHFTTPVTGAPFSKKE